MNLRSTRTATDPNSTGNDSIPIGNGSIPTGNDSIPIGNESMPTGNDSISLGNESIPTGNDSIRNVHRPTAVVPSER